MGADGSKKVVNKGFREEWIALSQPNRSHREANWNRSYVTIPLLCSERKRRFRECFKALKYKLYSSCSDCKYSRISEIRAEGGEKSSISGAIALICCDLRIEEQLYKK